MFNDGKVITLSHLHRTTTQVISTHIDLLLLFTLGLPIHLSLKIGSVANKSLKQIALFRKFL